MPVYNSLVPSLYTSYFLHPIFSYYILPLHSINPYLFPIILLSNIHFVRISLHLTVYPLIYLLSTLYIILANMISIYK